MFTWTLEIHLTSYLLNRDTIRTQMWQTKSGSEMKIYVKMDNNDPWVEWLMCISTKMVNPINILSVFLFFFFFFCSFSQAPSSWNRWQKDEKSGQVRNVYDEQINNIFSHIWKRLGSYITWNNVNWSVLLKCWVVKWHMWYFFLYFYQVSLCDW